MRAQSVHRHPHYAFAHRGGRAHGPDNTLETFALALQQGARGLETDAWVTADGAVVLDHDGVHRAAERRHRPMAEVLRADLPDHIPTLDDLYEQCGNDFDLAIDVRLPFVGDRVIEVARRHAALDRLWLVAEQHVDLVRWRPLSDEVRLAVTLRAVDRWRGLIHMAHRSGAEAINMRWMWWTRKLVARLHEDGLLCFAYDAQRPRSIERCSRLGVDGVFSDHVPLLVGKTD
ncbi:MAG TPA: glycerophosphodiester phosphodiesterase [Mycobacteriales bacterium]|nr:glycerophosphodiester phosphodiesterase [Mycobacteriales bacterium]